MRNFFIFLYFYCPTFSKAESHNTSKFLNCSYVKESSTCEVQVKSITTNDFKIQPPINSTSIKILDLNKNFDVHFMPQNISSTFPELQQMIFDHLALTKVTKSDLIALTKLQFLYLDSNLITKIDSDAFDDLQSLTLLDLDYNRLTSLHPDLFKKLKNLETFSIHDNYLTTLDEKIFSENSKLRSIKLHNNEINELSPYLLNNFSPAYIYLQNNKCISKQYSGTSLKTTFVVDVEKNCKSGRIMILDIIKDYSIYIIGVCLIIILLFIIYFIIKLIRKKQQAIMRPRPYQPNPMMHRSSTLKSNASCETFHIYDCIDESKVNQSFNDKAMYMNVLKWDSNGKINL
ncbi:hypothetical protein PVAND_014930 [Polypedilum vanderplanki]|uniref:Uncharacterized protein n=1 Tax=Polypedilum vanderplanki TaxID=319348 RepID=A0A9J6BB54_POLVA|nr:hypothetical protein PVAND_014930 [Polypedilum vanderplanki]